MGFQLLVTRLDLPANKACLLCHEQRKPGSRAADWQVEVEDFHPDYVCHEHLPLYVERVRDNLLAGWI